MISTLLFRLTVILSEAKDLLPFLNCSILVVAMKDILQEITRLRLERNWSEYQMSQNTGIPQSTISTWYRKRQTPAVQTLDKLCKGFGITLSQFFSEGGDAVALTAEQKDLLDNWSRLDGAQRRAVLELLRRM